jgi:transposase-like protein
MARKEVRVFRRTTKVSAMKRMLAGENVSALARELKVRRTILYRWRDEYKAKGEAAFRRNPGRPPRHSPRADWVRTQTTGELAAARQRIADLERKVGQQQVDLDFFRQALRQVEASRAMTDGRGSRAFTPSSKR